MIPLVKDNEIKGALSGGEIIYNQETYYRDESINHLASCGILRNQAAKYFDSLKYYDISIATGAAQHLFELFYDISGWKSGILDTNLANANQQRSIAEKIHKKKVIAKSFYSFQEEKLLFSFIRVGNKTRARELFNNILADMFIYNPKGSLLQARAIEMLGYLVRCAVEDNPVLEPLMEKHLHWINNIIVAGDQPENLWPALRDSLDELIDYIHNKSSNKANKKVERILNYISKNFSGSISLQDISKEVKLSTFRVSHLVKEHTGLTIQQHIKSIRISKAKELLLETDLSCTDIAYDLGFSDQSYFIRQFKQTTGTTPIKFRKRSY
ncbi:MAG: AraC family transcriptional regulator [Kiritimatiellae bacterium]|nr:AraC family transcriptional regulator [Kiritimatiellia bacterium]